MDVAYTLLLVDPGAGRRENDTARLLVEAIVKKRPAGEAIAIFRWGAEVTQIAPFNPDRRLLLERLSVGLVPSDTTLPSGEALAAAAAALAATGGPATDALRTVVLVNPRGAATAGLRAALDRAQPHLVVSLGGGDQDAQLAALPAGLRFPIPSQTVPALVVSALSDRLDAYKRHAHYAFGVCGQAEHAVQLRFSEGESSTLSLPAALPDNLPGACQPEALARGERVFPARLDLLFTPEQRALAAAAHLDRAHRPSFDLSVRVAAEAPPLRAFARYRGGDASYGCARRSYSLDLFTQDGEPRFLFPGSAARRFELVAMCTDRMYLRTLTTLKLLAEEGLFPVPFDLIELAIDGVSQGPYLIIENVSESLPVHSSRLSSVIRRRVAPGGTTTTPEVGWSALGNEGAAQASYLGILGAAMDQSGRRLESALDERFDLQGYLTWVALMNLVGSGGYRDEIFFYAAETTGADGNRADYHLMMGWDEDAVFTDCAAGGQAIVDPRGLVTCAQAELDRGIFLDSLLYARYAEVLSSVVERHRSERFAALARETAARVLAFLEKPEARAGLVELRALDPEAVTSFEVARTLLENELALLLGQFDRQWATLDDRLARFRGER